MKIGVVIGEIQNKSAGGSATFQISILNQLIKTKSEHEFYIFYHGKEKLFKDNTKFINLVYEIKFKKSFFRKKSKSKTVISDLNEKVLEHNIELVWFLVPNYHFVEVPFILTIWDLQHRLQPYFPEVSLSGWTFKQREDFYGNVVPKASYIVIGNSEGAKQVEKFYSIPIERIKIIPFSTPHFVFENSANEKILVNNQLEKNNYLLYPAQFWPHKNHIRIIKALNILKKQSNINLKVVFTGSDKGNEKYIKEKVKEYGLENDIKFLGFVSESELITLYKNAFAMTFLSMFGPDNIPPLEAMALNCPVICADAKGMKEQLGNSALFFNPVDENDLAEKIRLLINDKTLREKLIGEGKKLAFELTPDKYVEAMINLIDEFSPIRECWSSKEKFVHL